MVEAHCNATIGSSFILSDYFLLPIMVLSIFIAIRNFKTLSTKTRSSLYNSIYFFFACRVVMGTIAYMFKESNAQTFIKIVYYIYLFEGTVMFVLAFFAGLGDLNIVHISSKRINDFIVFPCCFFGVLWFSVAISNNSALFLILDYAVPAAIGSAFLIMQIIYLLRTKISLVYLVWLLPTIALGGYSIYNLGDNYFCAVFFSINSLHFFLTALAIFCLNEYVCSTRINQPYGEIGGSGGTINNSSGYSGNIIHEERVPIL